MAARLKCRPIPQLTERQIQQFWSMVDKSGGPDACWPWMGFRDKEGYGHKHFNGKCFHATRVAMFLVTGENSNLLALHDPCDYPPCCNPSHLKRGDHLTNEIHCGSRGRWGRRLTHYGSKGKLTENQVREIRKRLSTGEAKKTIIESFPQVHSWTIRRVISGDSWRHLT